MHEVQARLFVEHVAVQSSDFNAVRAQGADHRIDLLPGEDEVASDGGVPVPGRLEVDAGGNAEWTGRIERHPALGNLVTPRDTELVDATDRLPLGADNAVEFGGVEIDFGRSGRSGGYGQRRLARGKRLMKCFSEFYRIAVPADMHVERGRFGTKNVVVDGS